MPEVPFIFKVHTPNGQQSLMPSRALVIFPDRPLASP